MFAYVYHDCDNKFSSFIFCMMRIESLTFFPPDFYNEAFHITLLKTEDASTITLL